MGMSADEYWHGSPELMQAYRLAYKIRKQERNWELWLQGLYFCHALDDLLPQKMIPVMISLSGIDPRKKVHDITKEERRTLISLLKGLRIPLHGFRPIEEAIVTCGGVSIKEIDPKTMQSKLLPGLFFAGEVIDVDAYTGGFNLQIAFSTAVVAGESAAAKAAFGDQPLS